MSRLILPLLFTTVLLMLGSLPKQVHSNSGILYASPKVRRDADAVPAGGGKFVRPFGGNTRRQIITRRQFALRRKLRKKGARRGKRSPMGGAFKRPFGGNTRRQTNTQRQLAQTRKLRKKNRGKRSPLPLGRGKSKKTSGVNTRRQLTLKHNLKNKERSPRVLI